MTRSPRVRPACWAILLALVIAPPAFAGWASLGAFPQPAREGESLLFRGEQGVASVSVLAPEIVRVRFSPTRSFGRDHSYAVIRRDLGPAGASFRIGGAESVITTRALRVTIRHAPFRVAFRRGGRVAPPLLLWFHRLPWDHKLKSGRTLWDELVLHYARGAKEAASLEDRWKKLEGRVDRDRHQAVAAKLRRQVEDAAAWRDKCVRYFQGFSNPR